jgi:hypothetical protein
MLVLLVQVHPIPLLAVLWIRLVVRLVPHGSPPVLFGAQAVLREH